MCINLLIINDKSIFNYDEPIYHHLPNQEAILNRKLHETTINHRFAHYIENNLKETELENLFVDIEYNRWYENPKMLDTEQGRIEARPDIVVHSRMDDFVPIQHYLVIEAKKGNISNHDLAKIKGFINDDNYSYLFGLTISYCSCQENVISTLFYYDGAEIISKDIIMAK